MLMISSEGSCFLKKERWSAGQRTERRPTAAATASRSLRWTSILETSWRALLLLVSLFCNNTIIIIFFIIITVFIYYQRDLRLHQRFHRRGTTQLQGSEGADGGGEWDEGADGPAAHSGLGQTLLIHQRLLRSAFIDQSRRMTIGPAAWSGPAAAAPGAPEAWVQARVASRCSSSCPGACRL